MPTIRYDVFRNGEMIGQVFSRWEARWHVRRGCIIRIYDMVQHRYFGFMGAADE